MTRTTSIVLLSIITVLVLFLGVFSFIPSFYVSEYELYYSPYALIQKSNGFTDSVEAHYLVELDKDVNFSAVQRTIRARLRGAYGYYGVGISFDESKNEATITVPTRNNKAKTNVDSILNSVVANGNIEILNSATYSEDSVVLTQEHFRRARVRGYVNGSNSWMLVEIKLTKVGTELANASLTSGGTTLSNYFAIDGTISSNNYCDYNSGTVRLYAHSQEEAKLYASYINHGALNATLTDGDPQVTHEGLGFVFPILMGALFLASLIFFGVRYKDVGLVAALGQLLALVVFTIFAGLVHLEILNVCAAIGMVLAYAFMTFFTVYTFEKIRQNLNDGKTYASARYKAFLDSWKLNLIAHGALLVLGVILWVIPTLVTAPLGNVLVYGAVLSFAVTFGLNRLFTHWLSSFHEGRAVARDVKKK